MKNELFPAIDNNYSTNKDSVTIAGISFGGMLSTYVLFTQPEMFNGYIIIAPPLSWNYKSIFKLETEYFRNHKELDKTVYMAYGTLDDKDLIIDPTDEFIRIIQMRNYEGLKFVPQIFEGETHISVYSTALTNGLKNVFKR
jgi:predicted alpha/beta superfamily hydrolase